MEIDVELHNRSIGTLTVGAGGGIAFKFHESHIADFDRQILGQAFEDNLHRAWNSTSRLPEFFSNLLPEGAMRQLVAKQIGVPEHREVSLLLRLGQDLPGAASVAPSTEVDESELPGPNDPTSLKDAPLRFSLAGVQTKFSVLRHADKFTFPARGLGGDWIVKLPDLEFPGVPENEFSMMKWAERSGIVVPQFQLTATEEIEGLPEGIVRTRPGPSYAVARFDRSEGTRIHIEDFAQVFSVYPDNKYDRRFNFESIANVIAASCEESSLREYFRRLVFMVVSGNADMHLKNWSLRYARSVELSPAYDLVSTVVYPDVARELALNFSRSKSFDAVDRDHFRRMFERINRDPEEAERWLNLDLDQILAAWADLRDELPLTHEARAAIESHQQRLLLVKQFHLRPLR